MLGTVWQKLMGSFGNMNMAVKDYQQALEVNPDYADAKNIRKMLMAIKSKHYVNKIS